MVSDDGSTVANWLLSYGLSFVIVIFVIFVLFYFGVFSPKNFMPESCNLGRPLACMGAQITREGSMQILLKNGENKPLSINPTGASITLNEIGQTYNFDKAIVGDKESGSEVTLMSDGSIVLSMDNSTDLSEFMDKKVSATVSVKYVDSVTGFQHTSKGKLLTKIS